MKIQHGAVEQLKTAIITECQKLSQRVTDNTINERRRRLECVVKNEGGHSTYWILQTLPWIFFLLLSITVTFKVDDGPLKSIHETCNIQRCTIKMRWKTIVGKIVKIGVHLRKLSQKKLGYCFLDHSVVVAEAAARSMVACIISVTYNPQNQPGPEIFHNHSSWNYRQLISAAAWPASTDQTHM